MMTLKRTIQYWIWSFFWSRFKLPQIEFSEVNPSYQPEIPIITEGLFLPPYKGDQTLDDYSFLISLIKARNPPGILELGTAYGATVANICAVCDAMVFTVNALAEQMEGNITTISLSRDEIGSVYRKNGYAERVTQIFENTKNLKILRWVKPKSIDFAIIDACHDAEFVVNDFLKIFPALSRQAIVLFHDTHPSVENHYLDSYLGCMYLRKMGFNIYYLKNSSWGFWSALNPRYHQTTMERLKDAFFTLCGILLFGNRERFIRALRWVAGGFLRNKFIVR